MVGEFPVFCTPRQNPADRGLAKESHKLAPSEPKGVTEIGINLRFLRCQPLLPRLLVGGFIRLLAEWRRLLEGACLGVVSAMGFLREIIGRRVRAALAGAECERRDSNESEGYFHRTDSVISFGRQGNCGCHNYASPAHPAQHGNLKIIRNILYYAGRTVLRTRIATVS